MPTNPPATSGSSTYGSYASSAEEPKDVFSIAFGDRKITFSGSARGKWVNMPEWPNVVITISDEALVGLPTWATKTKEYLPDFVCVIAPDMQAPKMPAKFWYALWEDIKATPNINRVHAQCYAGHGRTGTFLSILLGILWQVEKGQKFNLSDVITFIRLNYCAKAVETKAQFDYIAKVLEIVDDTAEKKIFPSNAFTPVKTTTAKASEFADKVAMTEGEFIAKFIATQTQITGKTEARLIEMAKECFVDYNAHQDGKFQIKGGDLSGFPKVKKAKTAPSGGTTKNTASGKGKKNKAGYQDFKAALHYSYPNTTFWPESDMADCYVSYTNSKDNKFQVPGANVIYLFEEHVPEETIDELEADDEMGFPGGEVAIPLCEFLTAEEFSAALLTCLPTAFSETEDVSAEYEDFLFRGDGTFESGGEVHDLMKGAGSFLFDSSKKQPPNDAHGRSPYNHAMTFTGFVATMAENRKDVLKTITEWSKTAIYIAFNSYHEWATGFFWDGSDWRGFRNEKRIKPGKQIPLDWE